MTAMTTIALNTYLNSHSVEPNPHENLIFQLIKSIIHCRIMNIVTLHKVSELLRMISSHQDRHFLEYFCNKNCDMADKSDRSVGIIRFTSASCALQVYGACLETGPRYNWSLDASKINIIAEMAVNIEHFITISEDQQVTWLKQPPVGDTAPICPCMPKMICGFIQLLHTCLHAFRNTPNIFEMKTICYLAKAAILLLGHTFEQYEQYQIDIFTYGCGALMDVKSSFKTSVSILNKFKMEFGFEPIHGNLKNFVLF